MNRAYILWNDQVDWYYVCYQCYYENKEEQWGGSTNFMKGEEWEEYKEKVYQGAEKVEKCELCGREI